MNVHNSSRRGFSLVELLVVITVILILAGLLTVAVGAVQRGMAGTSCAANQRTIGNGMLAYALENAGQALIPFPYDGNDQASLDDNGNNNKWFRKLLRGDYLDRVNRQGNGNDAYYSVTTNRYFICPTVKNDPEYIARPMSEINNYQDLITYPMNYTFNMGTSWSNGQQVVGMNLDNGKARRLSSIVLPGIVPWIVDRDLAGDPTLRWSFLVGPSEFTVSSGNWANRVGPGAIHGGGSNVLFADGRVGRVPQVALQKSSSDDVKWLPLAAQE